MKTLIATLAALSLTACASGPAEIYQEASLTHARVDVNADLHHKAIGAYCHTGKAKYFSVSEHFLSITCSDFKYVSVKIKDF